MKKKTMIKLSSKTLIALMLSACGGGGSTDDGSSSYQQPEIIPKPVMEPLSHSQPTSTADTLAVPEIHIATDVNNQKALLVPNINQNTYTLSIRRPGLFTTGSEAYQLHITLPSDLRMLSNTCATSELHYGASCEFSIDANSSGSAQALSSANSYQPQQLLININATSISTGEEIHKTIPVFVVNNPLAVTLTQDDERGRMQWRTDNIQRHNIAHRNRRLNMNVPAIQTYAGFNSVTNVYPIMALKTRCADRLVYLVVQPKRLTALASTQGDNTTIKYHALISDGEDTGGVTSSHPATRAVSLLGQVRLVEGGHLIYMGNTVVSAHERLWSGPENIDRLRELITINTSPNNSTITSILDQLQGDPFIDVDNLGAQKIMTVHSLLNVASANDLRNALSGGMSVSDIVAYAAQLGSADEWEFAQAVQLYQAEVARACYTQV